LRRFLVFLAPFLSLRYSASDASALSRWSRWYVCHEAAEWSGSCRR